MPLGGEECEVPSVEKVARRRPSPEKTKDPSVLLRKKYRRRGPVMEKTALHGWAGSKRDGALEGNAMVTRELQFSKREPSDGEKKGHNGKGWQQI